MNSGLIASPPLKLNPFSSGMPQESGMPVERKAATVITTITPVDIQKTG